MYIGIENFLLSWFITFIVFVAIAKGIFIFAIVAGLKVNYWYLNMPLL